MPSEWFVFFITPPTTLSLKPCPRAWRSPPPLQDGSHQGIESQVCGERNTEHKRSLLLSSPLPASAHPAPIAHPSFHPTEDPQGQEPHNCGGGTGTWVSVLEVPPIAVLGPLFLKEDTGKKVGHSCIPTAPSEVNGAGSYRVRLRQGCGEQRDNAPLGSD